MKERINEFLLEEIINENPGADKYGASSCA